MESYLIIAVVGIILMAVVGYVLGKKSVPTQTDNTKAEMLEKMVAELQEKLDNREQTISQQALELRNMQAERDVQKANVANAQQMLDELRSSFDRQMLQAKEAHEKQIAALKQMNKEQVESQLNLIKEQMQTTSEKVLKMRQTELGEVNKEQVSKIIDPLQQSLKLMREALDDSKEKHQEALHKLDATIQANMKNSEHLSDTAARLTRALTGEVKVQGNFGELKLRQLLEDLGLKDGEQYSSQTHLRDKLGNLIKDDEGKGLIPDFILHFPNNRDVVVDSKMSFTAYERYVNSEEPEVQTIALKEHIISVRAQVDRLAKKDYSKYLQEGYNKLNFVIMYIHTEGALNLALLNDGALWREAYDQGVLILGPQTMYMNLRILELMWTQVRQLNNQEEMMKAANQIIDRTQDFAQRFGDVETKMRDTVKAMDKLKITTSESGASLITAAKNLIKAGGRENKKKKSIIGAIEADASASDFIDGDKTTMLVDNVASESAE